MTNLFKVTFRDGSTRNIAGKSSKDIRSVVKLINFSSDYGLKSIEKIGEYQKPAGAITLTVTDGFPKGDIRIEYGRMTGDLWMELAADERVLRAEWVGGNMEIDILPQNNQVISDYKLNEVK